MPSAIEPASTRYPDRLSRLMPTSCESGPKPRDLATIAARASSIAAATLPCAFLIAARLLRYQPHRSS